ncbi:MAG: DUF4143 domain-containing protein [Acidobacteria bacterium]|nr:DUF4143 domain-containing protein [Acidobacteriota bacterium]
MYLVFVVRPYSVNVARAVQGPFKAYFYDNLDVDCPEDRQPGARFENLVATHLRKKIDFLEDYTGEEWELAFLRDRDGREVDFVVVRDGAVDELVEAKLTNTWHPYPAGWRHWVGPEAETTGRRRREFGAPAACAPCAWGLSQSGAPASLRAALPIGPFKLIPRRGSRRFPARSGPEVKNPAKNIW